MSVRWQHGIDHADKIQKPGESPDCVLGVVPQPTDSRLSETTCECVIFQCAQIELVISCR